VSVYRNQIRSEKEALLQNKFTLREQELMTALILKQNELSQLQSQIQEDAFEATAITRPVAPRTAKDAQVAQYDLLFENSLDFDVDFCSNDEKEDDDEDLFSASQTKIPPKVVSPKKPIKVKPAPKDRPAPTKDRKQTEKSSPAVIDGKKKTKTTTRAQSQTKPKKKAEPKKKSNTVTTKQSQKPSKKTPKAVGSDDLSIFDFTD
jgi:hypothetical protein